MTGIWIMLYLLRSTNSFLLRPRSRLPTRRYLNRFLFDPDAVQGSNTIILPKDDYRTIHAAKILGLKNGDSIRAGIVGHEGLMTDSATIEWIPEGKVKRAEVLGNGNPPGSLEVTLHGLEPPSTALIPPVSLILALPRPLALGRMLPMISQMGVEHLVLTSAAKVPKDYFGSHLFRKSDELRERLIEGLCQAGDVRLPKLTVVRNLRDFLAEELDELFPSSTFARAIAHPQRMNDLTEPLRMRDVEFPSTERKIVLAVGPEGGWEEPDELERFKAHSFQQITLGPRTLRSDCAVVSLLSLAHDRCLP